MKNTTLTLSFNTEKLDALTFHMGKKDADLQGELNDTIQTVSYTHLTLPTILRV